MSEPTVVTTTDSPYEVTGVDQYVSGPVSVLIEWLILLISTIIGYFQNK